MVSRDDASTSGGKCTDFTILNASVFKTTTIQSNPLRFLCPLLVVSLGFWVVRLKKKLRKQIVSGKQNFLLKNQG